MADVSLDVPNLPKDIAERRYTATLARCREMFPQISLRPERYSLWRQIRSALLWIRFLVSCAINVSLWTGIVGGTHEIQAEPSSFAAQTWTSENGLADNSISAIAQTPDGFLWVATQSSLARFDGAEFVRRPLGETPPINLKLIRAMLCDRSGTLWCSLESGPMLRITPRGIETVPLTNGSSRDWATSLAEDAAGAIWVAYQQGRVCRIEKGMHSVVSSEHGVPEKSPARVCADREGTIWLAEGDEIRVWRNSRFVPVARDLDPELSICPRSAGGIWIAESTGVRSFDEHHGLTNRIAYPDPKRQFNPSITYEDSMGRLWIGNFGGGLFCYDGASIVRIPTPTDDILALHEDRERNLWIGTEGGGLTRLRTRRAKLISMEEGLPTSAARSICSVGDQLWITSRNGEVITVNANGKLRRRARPPFGATCVSGCLDGRIWIGTGNLGLFSCVDDWYNPVTGHPRLTEDNVRALFVDSRGGIWASGQTSGIHFDGKREIWSRLLPRAGDYVRAFAEDSGGLVWAGTASGRLLQIRDSVITDVTPGMLNGGESVRTLCAGADGSLWIGFAEHGLGRWRDGIFHRIGSNHGLWNDGVSQILEDGRGNLWIGSDRGYFEMQIRDIDDVMSGRAKTVRSRLFGRGENLPVLQASFGYSPNAARLSDGRLAFSTSLGVLLVDPVPGGSLAPLRVYLKAITTDGVRQDEEKMSSLRLSSTAQRIEFEFGVVHLSSPENVFYRYRLSGLDTDWSAPTRERHAAYSRLPYGDYVFQVSATEGEREWSETGVSVIVNVAPSVTETTWFRYGLLLILVTAAAGVARWLALLRVRKRLQLAERESAIERERARIARDMHDELGATLTQIALLSDLRNTSGNGAESISDGEEVANGSEISTKARAALRSLNEIVWAVNPRNDTADHLLEYLGQFAVEYLHPAGIRCRIDFPDHVPRRVLLSEQRHHLFLSAKEALHNAVKHSGASEVRIVALIDDCSVTLSIEDDGHGLNGRAECPFANGLRNMHERLTQAGGTARIEPGARGGTRVVLVLPWVS